MLTSRRFAILLLLIAVFVSACSAPPSPSPAADSTLTVVSVPAGASVLVDGVPSGLAPISLTLAPGNYSISLARADYLPYEETVHLQSGDNTSLEVLLDPIIEAPIILRVNAGGPQYVARSGIQWSADQGFAPDTNTGEFNAAITGTEDSALYQTERWAPNATTGLRYSFPVDVGAYLVRLHFAEIYPETFGVGRRVFSVTLENETVLTDFDIFAEAGPNTALVKEFMLPVTDGALTLTLRHGVENPKVCAIEVIKLTSPAPDATLSTSRLQFPSTPVNATTTIQQLFITNTGAEVLSIPKWQKTGESAGDFIIGANASYRLLPGETAVVNVLFVPGGVGPRSALLNFTANTPQGSIAFSLAGTGESTSIS